MRRMDRYNNDNLTNTSSRRDKNEELYKEVNSNVKYTNITDVANANAYDITSKDEISSKTSREDYHKLKDYANISGELKEKKQLDEFNYLYKDKENKIYDINTVMEEARKNRGESEEEAKRKLQDTNYNVLAGLNKEELEKYRKEKQERVIPPDEEELREIIDTITSKTLAGDISKETSVNLLSDLMATQALDKVAAQASEQGMEMDLGEAKYKTITDEGNESLNKEDIEKIKEKKDEVTDEVTNDIMKKADTDFYTKSMDLSDKDFSMSDDFDDKPMPFILKLFIFLVIVAILVAGGFYIYIHYFK